jgi:pimeloyl-ACP methyl ester carboxylesterase
MGIISGGIVQFGYLLLPVLKMSLPVLIVWGRQDKSIPVKLAQDMHHILKGSRLEVIDEAGHCPNDEQPEVFNRLAMEFLLSKSKG